jgi:TolA-binding protein
MLRVFCLIIFIAFISISSSGCAEIPFFGDFFGGEDEEEVELESDFESEFGEEIEDEFADNELDDEIAAIGGVDVEEVESLKDEISALRTQQEDAQFKMEELENTISSMAPRLENIEGLEGADDSREIEELRGIVQQLVSEIGRLKGEVARRGFEESPRSQPVDTSSETPIFMAPRGSFQREYDKSHRLFKIKQYKESLHLFQSLDNNETPNDFRDDVIFWIGQSYFMMEDYQNAAESFNTVVENYQNEDKALDSMYMLGASYEKLGRKK